MSDGIEVTYQGGLRCQATLAASGQTILTDAASEHGGRGEAFSPSDLVAAAVATCVMTIMSMIAQRNQVELAGMTAHVEKELAGTTRIGSIRVTIRIPGAGITPTVRSKLEAAVDKCLVKRSLHPEIDVAFEVLWV